MIARSIEVALNLSKRESEGLKLNIQKKGVSNYPLKSGNFNALSVHPFIPLKSTSVYYQRELLCQTQNNLNKYRVTKRSGHKNVLQLFVRLKKIGEAVI